VFVCHHLCLATSLSAINDAQLLPPSHRCLFGAQLYSPCHQRCLVSPSTLSMLLQDPSCAATGLFPPLMDLYQSLPCHQYCSRTLTCHQCLFWALFFFINSSHTSNAAAGPFLVAPGFLPAINTSRRPLCRFPGPFSPL